MKKIRIFFLLTTLILVLACRFSSDSQSTADPGGVGVPLPPDEDFGVLCFVEFADVIVASAPVFEAFTSRDGGLTWQSDGQDLPGISGSDCTPNKKLVHELWASPDGEVRYRFDPGKTIDVSTDGGKHWEQAVDLTGIQWEPANAAETGKSIVVQPGPLDAMVDPHSGNVLLAMGHAGVLIGLPSGEWQWVKVGPYANAELSSLQPEISQAENSSHTAMLITPDLEINTENNYVNALAFAPNGNVLAASGFEGGVKLFGFPSGDFQSWLQWGEDARFRKLFGAVFSADGQTLVTCGTNVDQSLRFWDVDSWNLNQEFQGFQTNALDAGAYDGGQFIAIAYQKDTNNPYQVKVYRLPESVEAATLSSRLSSITSLLIVPETRYLAVGSASGGVEVLDIITGESIYLFEPDSLPTEGVAVRLKVSALGYDASENLVLALLGNGRLYAYDLSTGGSAWQLALAIPHGWYISSAAFSEDGRLVAMGMHNGPLLVFNTNSGEMFTRQWITDGGTLQQVAFSPDNQWIAAGFTTGKVRVWQVERFLSQN